MSTISSTQEAYEALCAGELFQVGGRFINPSDIVEVDPNDGQNPIFYLEDGRTVQHDRFKEGDVGDYLADALQYATRGQAQAQAIRPTFNQVWIGDPQNNLYDSNASPTTALPACELPRDADPGVALIGSTSPGSVVYIDLTSGASKSTWQINSNPTYVCGIDRSKKRVYVVEEGSNNMSIYAADYDGSNATVKNANYRSAGYPSIGTYTIDVQEGVAIDIEGSSTFHRVPLDGSPSTTLSVTARYLSKDPKVKGQILNAESGRIETIDINSGSKNLLNTFNDTYGAWGGDDIWVVDAGANELIRVDRSTGNRVETFFSNTINDPNGTVVYTDLSLI